MLSEFPGGDFFIFGATWYEEIGPKVWDVKPDKGEMEEDLLQLAGRCFLAGIGTFEIVGDTIAENIAQFPLFSPAKYAYVFFGAWKDPAVRGGVRPFELVIVFDDQLSPFQEAFLTEITKKYLNSYLHSQTIDLTELYQEIYRSLGQFVWNTTADVLKAFAGDLQQQCILSFPDKKEIFTNIFKQTLEDYVTRFKWRD
ncbi:MAG: hypothetical protein ACFFCQ_05345 [Promethearchaeota archaeon]